MELDDKLLQARILDAVSLCERRWQPQFLGFLDERQKALCSRFAVSAPGVCFWGGHEAAERTLIGVFPTEETGRDAFPITAFEAVFCRDEKLCHRDVLGALMGLGIKRETVGDILIEPGRAVFFLQESAAGYVRTELRKIGRVNVACRELEGQVSVPPPKTELLERTVSSPRLDGILGAVLPLSRAKCSACIAAGQVMLRHTECKKPDAAVCEGDVFSVRGYGKFRLEKIHGQSKKGRLRMTITRYV